MKEIAQEARDTLDDAMNIFANVLEANQGKESVLKVLKEQEKQLGGTRELLTKFIFQGNLRINELQQHLQPVKETVDKLKKLLAGGKPESLNMTRLAHAVGDVAEATSNLKRQIPGNVFTTIGVHTKKYAVNMPGVVSETPVEMDGSRMMVEVKDVVAEEFSVTTGPLFSGSLAALGNMQQTALRHAALAEGKKEEVRNSKSDKLKQNALRHPGLAEGKKAEGRIFKPGKLGS